MMRKVILFTVVLTLQSCTPSKEPIVPLSPDKRIIYDEISRKFKEAFDNHDFVWTDALETVRRLIRENERAFDLLEPVMKNDVLARWLLLAVTAARIESDMHNATKALVFAADDQIDNGFSHANTINQLLQTVRNRTAGYDRLQELIAASNDYWATLDDTPGWGEITDSVQSRMDDMWNDIDRVYRERVGATLVDAKGEPVDESVRKIRPRIGRTQTTLVRPSDVSPGRMNITVDYDGECTWDAIVDDTYYDGSLRVSPSLAIDHYIPETTCLAYLDEYSGGRFQDGWEKVVPIKLLVVFKHEDVAIDVSQASGVLEVTSYYHPAMHGKTQDYNDVVEVGKDLLKAKDGIVAKMNSRHVDAEYRDCMGLCFSANMYTRFRKIEYGYARESSDSLNFVVQMRLDDNWFVGYREMCLWQKKDLRRLSPQAIYAYPGKPVMPITD